MLLILVTLLSAVLFFALRPAAEVQAIGTYQNQEVIPGAAGQTTDFVTYLKQVIGFGYAVIGILAMFMLAVGAYQYLMAAGNLSKAESAKNTVSSAILGLVLGLMSFVILRTINPDLVSLRGIDLSGLNIPNYPSPSGNTGIGTTPPTGPPVSTTANCGNLNSDLNSALNSADNDVPPALLAAFMQRECAQAMANPNACGSMNSKGLAGGPMQFTPGTWNGLGCSGSMYNRQDALNCAAKKISQDSGGDYSDAGIMQAARRYCGACVNSNCGNDNYCQGILANYNVYKNCSLSVLIKLLAKNYGYGEKIILRSGFCTDIFSDT